MLAAAVGAGFRNRISFKTNLWFLFVLSSSCFQKMLASICEVVQFCCSTSPELSCVVIGFALLDEHLNLPSPLSRYCQGPRDYVIDSSPVSCLSRLYPDAASRGASRCSY
uniref:Putative secreted protein n=1 Tax=Anopheles darlingi TaxID=43151 RepID=A0A2M4D1E6_ANODA